MIPSRLVLDCVISIHYCSIIWSHIFMLHFIIHPTSGTEENMNFTQWPRNNWGSTSVCPLNRPDGADNSHQSNGQAENHSCNSQDNPHPSPVTIIHGTWWSMCYWNLTCRASHVRRASAVAPILSKMLNSAIVVVCFVVQLITKTTWPSILVDTGEIVVILWRLARNCIHAGITSTWVWCLTMLAWGEHKENCSRVQSEQCLSI